MNRRIRFLLASLLLSVATAFAADTPAPATFPTEAYASVGSSFIRDNRLELLGWNDTQIEAFLRGVRAALQGDKRPADPATQELLNEIGRRLQQLEQEDKRRRYGAAAFTRPGYLQSYLKHMQQRFELQASDSGLCFGIRNAGFGARPEPEDTVIISYKVTAADAEKDVPGIGGEKLRVKVSELVPGVAEGLQMMTVGSVAMLLLPPDLSYGSGEWPAKAERNTPLIFTVVLHEIVSPTVTP